MFSMLIKKMSKTDQYISVTILTQDEHRLFPNIL